MNIINVKAKQKSWKKINKKTHGFKIYLEKLKKKVVVSL
jgi:hypothetical protein